MTRRRLRDYPSDAELAQLYATPHDHTRFKDHHLRVGVTVEVGRWLIQHYASVRRIGDLSCGDATVVRRLHLAAPDATLYLGDYAEGYPFTGPLEKTINEIPMVDLYVCSETIEHLDDPDQTLVQLRAKAKTLVLSTPIDETPEVGNPEHVWGWDVGDVRQMLRRANWDPVCLNRLELPDYTYDFQIWGCR